MSLAIDVDHVEAVLLDDGWHGVADNSFTLDAYEFLWWSPRLCKDSDDPMILHGGGRAGICSTGFSFRTADGHHLSGPLSAVLAVRHRYDDCRCRRCEEEAA